MGAGVPLTEADSSHLRRAMRLAEVGRGATSPNPLVGAVLVSDDEVIGAGFHAAYGGPHAEVAAINDCRARGEDPVGATLYVNLEPCNHQGEQPPCTEAILDAGISRVVYACEDPSDHASGAGPARLGEFDVDVVLAGGEVAREARRLNQPFFKRVKAGRPHVTLKLAMSLDGRVAGAGGEQRWISGERSRELSHRWRAGVDAIAVGAGTALADDPLLTARAPVKGRAKPRQPLRVVFDSDARLPLDSQLVTTAGEAPLLVVVAPGADPAAVDALQAAGAEVFEAEGRDYDERVEYALDELGDRGLNSLLLEGGPRLAGAFLEAREVDALRLFYAPLLIGGDEPRPPVEGAELIGGKVRELKVKWRIVGEDLLAESTVRSW